MIRVVVVDDQALVRQGIQSLLALTPDIRAVAEASDGEQALEIISRTEVDVVLLDVRMPRRTGLGVLEALRERPPPQPAVILLTTFDDDSVAFQGIRLGARGFLLKDVTLDELASAVRRVAAGESLFRPAVTARVLEGLSRAPPAFEAAELPEPLTPREIDVLRLMASGASNKEIAAALGTAEGTVKNQVSSIMSKLGVRDRTRAVLKGIELGYV